MIKGHPLPIPLSEYFYLLHTKITKPFFHSFHLFSIYRNLSNLSITITPTFKFTGVKQGDGLWPHCVNHLSQHSIAILKNQVLIENCMFIIAFITKIKHEFIQKSHKNMHFTYLWQHHALLFNFLLLFK